MFSTTAAVMVEYQSRLDQIQAALAAAASRQAVASLLAGLALGGCLLLAWTALSRRTVPVWYSPLSLPVAAVCAGERRRQAWARSRLGRLARFYSRGLARLGGQWAGTGEPGGEYLDEAAGHVFARDLNLFGPGSLFERLSLARSEAGRRRLAGWLLEPAGSREECQARQEAVVELSSLGEAVREPVELLGEDHQQARAATFSAWLARDAVSFPCWARITAALLSGAMALCLVMLIVVSGSAPWAMPLAIGLAVAEAALGLALRGRVQSVIDSVHTLSVELALLREGVEWLATRAPGFSAPMLRGLSEAARAGGSVRALRRLERFLAILTERNKEWFYAPSLLLLAGTQTAMALEAWRSRHGEALAGWLAAWAEFEALHSLGCYAHENPEDCFPEFAAEQDPAVFEAESLGHPLLEGARCVRNDVRLGTGAVTIVSGSNMAGKSTLLRSVGVAAVLAFAGAPVRARQLRLSLMPVCASLSVPDSLRDGRSRFLAEVERLREAIRLATQSARALFLIDEILSGTNSRDRRIAAGAILAALVAAGGIGIVSTHDLALTELGGAHLNVVNVHMGARDGAAGPLDFDYLVKPGVTTESSALAIARLAGVPL